METLVSNVSLTKDNGVGISEESKTLVEPSDLLVPTATSKEIEEPDTEAEDLGVPLTKGMVANCDRLSALPDEILYHIYSRRQTIELVQASVLSKRWRYLWTKMPFLNFDRSEMVGNGRRQETSKKFVELMKLVFCFRDRAGSRIERLRISSNFDSDLFWLNRWFQLICTHKVKDIEFNYSAKLDADLFDQFPHVVFYGSPEVLKVDLEHCGVTVPFTLHCTLLKTLHLVGAEFVSDDYAREIFSNCPLLQEVTFEKCTMIDVDILEILAPNLIHFTFVNIGWGALTGCSGAFEGVLKVVAPNLLSFVYYGFILEDVKMESLLSLESASIRFLDLESRPDLLLCRMVEGFHNAKILRLAVPFFGDLQPPGRRLCFPTEFSNLKSLELSASFIASNLEVLIHFLEQFLYLESLVIDCGQLLRSVDVEWSSMLYWAA